MTLIPYAKLEKRKLAAKAFFSEGIKGIYMTCVKINVKRCVF